MKRADRPSSPIPALERYSVRAVVVRENLPKTSLVSAWEMALATEGATVVRGEAGTRMQLSDGVTLDILYPGPDPVAVSADNTNNDSIVMRLSYRDVAFLLSGDIEAEVEKELIRSGTYLRSTVLKVPHHGSDTSSSRAFLEAVSPQVAVISVGRATGSDTHLRRCWSGSREPLSIAPIGTAGWASPAMGHRLWIEKEH